MINLMIVDDENIIVEDLKSGVDWEKLNITNVYTASNINAAKEIFNTQNISILLCDIEMPHGNGLELLSWVREHFSETETIFLTCHADFNYAIEAIRKGSFDYLLKPITYEDLEIVLCKAIRMIQVMKKVRQGDLHSRIEIQEVSEEFRVVNDTFNKMMAEISELKISIYEEKIGRQNTELMYLQMQVNPHFFLNTLNILYSLARTQKYGLIQEMVMCLIKHFRYMFKKDSAFVSLEEELQHVENYIKIQQMRFTDKIKYEISVPDFLLDLRIPSLLIVMFVENSVKYAITPENTVCIKIAIDIEKRSDILYLKILIEDTGIGFDEEILEKLRNGQTLSDDKGDHIGIRNVQRRLEMMYSDRAYLNLENCKDGGASVEILIPADYMGMNRLGCEL